MPLTYDLTKCADVDALQTDEAWPLTTTLIHCCIGIGIGTWTEANAPEVYARIALLEAVYGSFVTTTVDGERKDRPITPEDVRAMIGLKTNVFPVETRASFLKRHVAYRLDENARRYTRAVQHPPVTLAGGDIPAHVPGAYPRLSCCGGPVALVDAPQGVATA